MLKVNSKIKLDENREFLVEREILLDGQIYYVLLSSEDDYNEKIFVECVESEGDKYIRVVQSIEIAEQLAEICKWLFYLFANN